MNYSLDKGVFIAFEGTDGAGKSTVARATYDRILESHSALHFIDKNRPPVPTGYTEFHMSRLREVLWDYPDNAPLEQLGDKHWMSLITAWFQATDHAAVTPLTNSGISCIADGWHHKYLARFLLKNDDLADQALALFSTIRKPDHVIFLDVDPILAAKRKVTFRLSESGAYDGANEDRRKGFIEYQNRVRSSYERCGLVNWTRIDTTDLSEEAVLDKAVTAVQRILCKK
ncbi:thymidylate kinase [Pseudomonas fluorescens]|uniref:Thymidylate kinase n=1 Tax=Pseudomonas fluorescens TaxID=294 RepID=A0AAP8Z116_PSEFL|nr:thymidylate kinase [Pseudomonas fluorescens]QBX42939.1 thymidylate kinase [Pseudomonas fluorescens]